MTATPHRHGWLLAVPTGRPRHRGLLTVAVLVWLVVVGAPTLLAVRQASFYLSQPVEVVSATLSHCTVGECRASYRVAGRSYTAIGLSGRDASTVRIAVARSDPASWRSRSASVYVVTALVWLLVGLPGVVLVFAGRRLRR